MIIYLVGFAFVIGGVAWALVIAGLSTCYVMIAVIILVGVAILTGVKGLIRLPPPYVQVCFY